MDDRVDDRKKTIRALKILHIRQSKFQSLYDNNKHRQVSCFNSFSWLIFLIYQQPTHKQCWHWHTHKGLVYLDHAQMPKLECTDIPEE